MSRRAGSKFNAIVPWIRHRSFVSRMHPMFYRCFSKSTPSSKPPSGTPDPSSDPLDMLDAIKTDSEKLLKMRTRLENSGQEIRDMIAKQNTAVPPPPFEYKEVLEAKTPQELKEALAKQGLGSGAKEQSKRGKFTRNALEQMKKATALIATVFCFSLALQLGRTKGELMDLVESLEEVVDDLSKIEAEPGVGEVLERCKGLLTMHTEDLGDEEEVPVSGVNGGGVVI